MLRLLLLLIHFPILCGVVLAAEPLQLIPPPSALELREGHCDAALQPVFKTDSSLPAEGYLLELAPHAITVTSATPAGAFYAKATLRQIIAQRAASNTGTSLPCLQIRDAPRFAWRGFMLDSSRHFFAVDSIKRMLDLMAERKLNVFHWHLVDGPGWRIEIKSHPELTARGAWRIDKRNQPWNWRATELCSKDTPGAYGGYYSQDDIREIVRYAKERFITVVPEIEMPGHSYAALMAHPELACDPATLASEGLRGKDAFCAGNEGSFALLLDVLDEVCTLFPDAPFIHLGGDEVSTDAWRACTKCQARLRELGQHDPRALEADFLKKMADHLTKKGRKAMVWDDAAAGTLPPACAVMNWHDEAHLKLALAQNRPVVRAPISLLYLDYALSPVPPNDAPSAGRGPTLEQIRAFDPVAGLSAEQAKLVLGVEACLWTEHVQTEERARELMLPRLDALAEIGWHGK